jgi:hypothetical protein
MGSNLVHSLHENCSLEQVEKMRLMRKMRIKKMKKKMAIKTVSHSNLQRKGNCTTVQDRGATTAFQNVEELR